MNHGRVAAGSSTTRYTGPRPRRIARHIDQPHIALLAQQGEGGKGLAHPLGLHIATDPLGAIGDNDAAIGGEQTPGSIGIAAIDGGCAGAGMGATSRLPTTLLMKVRRSTIERPRRRRDVQPCYASAWDLDAARV